MHRAVVDVQLLCCAPKFSGARLHKRAGEMLHLRAQRCVAGWGLGHTLTSPVRLTSCALLAVTSVGRLSWCGVFADLCHRKDAEGRGGDSVQHHVPREQVSVGRHASLAWLGWWACSTSIVISISHSAACACPHASCVVGWGVGGWGGGVFSNGG